VYDLPNFGPAVTTEYLREIMKKDSSFVKVKRDQTHTIPKGDRIPSIGCHKASYG